MGYVRGLIVLKDAGNHDDYNKPIIEYLNDRHTAINKNKYSIAIEIADEANINDFVLKGMKSLPFMWVSPSDPFIYGVISIIAILETASGTDSFSTKPKKQKEPSNDINAYYNMVLEKMKNKEDDDNKAPSTIKTYRADFPEAPLTEKMIEEHAKHIIRFTKIEVNKKNSEAQSTIHQVGRIRLKLRMLAK